MPCWPLVMGFLLKCGVRAVIRFLYSEQATRNVVLRYCSRPHTAAITKRLLKRFRWEVFDHPPSSARTWLPVIFISFLVLNGRYRTTFWQNELQTSVENCLKTQAVGFYDEVLKSWYHATKSVYNGASTMLSW